MEPTIEQLKTALAGLVRVTHMKLVQNKRGWWYCPICKAESTSLKALEQGIEHKPDCEFAEARLLIAKITPPADCP